MKLEENFCHENTKSIKRENYFIFFSWCIFLFLVA